MRKIASFILLCTATIGAWAAAADGVKVTFSSADGVRLSGRLFGNGRTGVVLGHMYPTDQKSWWPFAALLAAKGYTALAFDFRGYGESSGEPVIAQIDRDMEAAYSFLKPKVDRIVVAGASMGGTAALKVAARQPVAGVIAISAPTGFKGLNALVDVPRITAPKLFIASSGDTFAAASVGDFMRAAKDPKQEQIFSGAYHGTYIFGTEYDAVLTQLFLAFLGGLKPHS